MDKRKKDHPEAVTMYTSGLSLAEVAAFYGVTRQAMWEWLKARGVAMRPNLRFAQENHFFRGTKAEKKAIHLVEKALKKGVLIRPPTCSQCGQPKVFKNGRSGIEAHHEDYSKPLTVIWLCQNCHHNLHKDKKSTLATLT